MKKLAAMCVALVSVAALSAAPATAQSQRSESPDDATSEGRGITIENSRSGPVLAAGVLYSLDGKPVDGGRIAAYAIDESDIKEHIWLPIAISETDSSGNFTIRAEASLKNASVEDDVLRVGFMAQSGTDVTFFEHDFIASEAEKGQWVPFTHAIDPSDPNQKTYGEEPHLPGRLPLEADEPNIPRLTTEDEMQRSEKSETEGASSERVEMFRADEKEVVLGQQWIDAVKTNRVLGAADGYEGISLELAIDTTPAADTLPDLQFAAKATSPTGHTCANLFYGDQYSWGLVWNNEYTFNQWVSMGLARNKSTSSGFNFNTKTKTEATILLKIGSAYGGTLGYKTQSGGGWGGYISFGTWRRQEPRLEGQFGDYRLYCFNYYDAQYNYQQLWTNIVKTELQQWTGGTQRYWTNLDFNCSAGLVTSHVGNVWVSNYETRTVSAGVWLKGFSLNSKQTTNSNIKLTHFAAGNSSYALCGSDNYAVYADHSKQI